MKNNCQVVPNDETLQYFFYFMQERMNIFWRKSRNPDAMYWTDDPILRMYKFTNVYRSTDRVSQYMLKNVIYGSEAAKTEEDLLLQILIFKIFNRPDTWEYLKQEMVKSITVESFDPHQIAEILSLRQRIAPIFNNAYMMTGSHRDYTEWPTKHERWLQMVKREIIDSRRLAKLVSAQSLKEMYDILHDCPFIGGFLAYQYAIDMNYAPFKCFDENSFVKAGIGAIRGIKKCFVDYGSEYEDAIRYVQEHFVELQKQYGFTEFRPLPGHAPKLIDLQNCFCETDKYLRAKMPNLKIDNVRIKQKYKLHYEAIEYFFPPAWNITGKINYEPKTEMRLFP